MTAQELVNKLQLHESITANRILSLSQEKINQMLEHFDPGEDELIHVCNSGFSVNHGSVGSRGIDYDFI